MNVLLAEANGPYDKLKEVDYAKQVVVLRRSMNTGFGGIENELFSSEKTSLEKTSQLFGDARSLLTKLVGEIKNCKQELVSWDGIFT